MYKFNKEKFAELLKKAIHYRAINEYGREVGVSGSHISRLLRELTPAAPSPETIHKLASKALNGVTYEQMMIAAGHLPDPDDPNPVAPIIVTKKMKKHSTPISKVAPKEIADEFKKMQIEYASFIEENHVTPEELKKILDIIREIKK